jgi:integrase
MPERRERRGRRGNNEGSIGQRSDGRWRAQITLEDGSRKDLYGRTREEVVGKLQDAQAEQKAGRLATDGRAQVVDWLDQWLEDYVKPAAQASPRTYETYENAVRVRLQPELQHVTLGKLTPTRVQRCIRRLVDRGYAPKTINFTYTVLSMALKQARQSRLISYNPAEDVKPPQRPRSKARDKTLSADQVRTLDLAMHGHHYEYVWRLLLATGLRWGELAALRWSDIDWGAQHITIDRAYTRVKGGMFLKEPKTPREVPVPLVPPAVAALRAQKIRVAEMQLAALEWTDNDLVFPNLKGQPLRNNDPLRQFQKVLAAAGLPKRTLHGLRHTFATQLFAHGVHVKAAQQLLGHSRPDMTLSTYTGSDQPVLRDAVNQLADLFEGQA